MLNEMPVAVLGDWDNKIIKSPAKTKKVLQKYWELQDKVIINNRKLEIYKLDKKLDNQDTYILGAWGYEELNDEKKEVFIIITKAVLLKRKDLTSQFKEFHNVYQMKKINTITEFRGDRFTKQFYIWFISQKMEIVSDMVQYDGARAMYSSLSKLPSIKAYIIDAYEKEIIKKDTIVKQGFDDWDFDEEVWSYDFKKSNILIVLKAK